MAISLAFGQAIEPGFDANTLPPNDDGSIGPVSIGFEVNFFGVNRSQLWVNNNGNITFDGELLEFTPFDLTSTEQEIIAPFFADVDTRNAGDPVTYGEGTFEGRPAFGVNYVNVDYFPSDPSHANRNSFQLLLVDRSDIGAGDFDIVFNYDQIQWEAGTASGGDPDGLGGNSARAGFSNGTGDPGTSFELPGSAINGAFLDGGPNALAFNRLNSNLDGRYIFESRSSEIDPGIVDPLGLDVIDLGMVFGDGLSFVIFDVNNLTSEGLDSVSLSAELDADFQFAGWNSLLPSCQGEDTETGLRFICDVDNIPPWICDVGGGILACELDSLPAGGTASVVGIVSGQDFNIEDHMQASVSVLEEEDVSPSFQDCADCPVMVPIPAGSFTQGSPESELESFDNERPQRQVDIQAFAMGQTEVTFEEWDACVVDGGCTHTPDDQGWGRGDRPVINVSWDDAQEYVIWLSGKTGHHYRLPSESEWEFATRAGTLDRFNTGDCITTVEANFDGTNPAQGCAPGDFEEQTLSVGSFASNTFGLFDTHGNVYEWVQDCWNESYVGAPSDGSAWMSGDCSPAVARGGSWISAGNWLRSAFRNREVREGRFNDGGFRVARSLPQPAFQDCEDCPSMIMIPSGTFTQGSPESEPESLSRERPQREVTVAAFAMGQTAVTFEQWDLCLADGGCTHEPDDQGWGRGNRPVIDVSWDDAQEYVLWLSDRTGHDYRLPSESEWEYAARAGTNGRYNTGNCITTDQANFNGDVPAQGCPNGESLDQTLPVASYDPNAFGLFDTHGNAWEWVQDCVNTDYIGAPTDGSAWMTGDCIRAGARGGSWDTNGANLRSAFRGQALHGFRSSAVGFRVARSVTP